MEFKRWKNKYIELVGSKPGKILACPDDKLSDSERDILQQNLRSCSQVYCDLGSGSGGHTIEQARLLPEALFLAVEVRFKRAFRTIEKAEGLGIGNILVVRLAVQDFLVELPDNSVQGFFINFPDPWDKPRWFKNRLINERFISALSSKLKIGGFISYKSDHRRYFEQACDLFKNSEQLQIERISYDLHAESSSQSAGAQANIMSEFEKLFRFKGLAVNLLLLRKSLDKSAHSGYN